MLKELKTLYVGQNPTKQRILDDILDDYDNLIALRNRLHDDINPTIYEEDSILLDHILDYIEIMMIELKGEQNNGRI